MYTSAVDSLLRNGTTCACYYATMHVEPSILLAEVCHAKGQRAFVGKVMSLWTLTYLFLILRNRRQLRTRWTDSQTIRKTSKATHVG